jgi:hypothetical protein
MVFIGVKLFAFAGIMTDDEQKALENIQDSRKSKPKVYFVPLVWAARLVTLARKEGRIKDDFAVKTLIDVCSLFWIS